MARNSRKQFYWRVSIIGFDGKCLVFSRDFSNLRDAGDFFGLDYKKLVDFHQGRMTGNSPKNAKYSGFRIEKIFKRNTCIPLLSREFHEKMSNESLRKPS